MDDWDLLLDYAQNASEQAFEAIVFRYTDLVYSTALRHVREPERAKEVTQMVFMTLARKASSISQKARLSGWLFRTTCYVAADLMKAERRRAQREHQAASMASVNVEAEPESLWQQINSLLNELLMQLKDEDRTALLLRFFEMKNLKEIGSAMGTTEEAAKKRVARASERLRLLFQKHGVVLSVATLAELLPSHAVQAAPAGLAAAIFTHTIISASALVPASAPLLKGTLAMIGTAKVKTAILATALIALTGTTLFISHEASSLHTENAALRKLPNEAPSELAQEVNRLRLENGQIPRLRAENVELHKLRNEVHQLREQQRALETSRRDDTRGAGEHTAFLAPSASSESQGTTTFRGALAKTGELEFPASGQLNAFDAIESMGGISDFAGSTLRVLRGTNWVNFNFNLRTEKEALKNIWLQPGDVVDVPKMLF